jgi:HEAT repeat protein
VVALGTLAALVASGSRDRRLRRDAKDERPAVRAAALRSLSLAGNEGVFIAALKDENADVRMVAAQQLGEEGPKGGARAEALVGALEDERANVRREAVESLAAIGPEAWPAIREALQHGNSLRLAGAAHALHEAYFYKKYFDRKAGWGEKVPDDMLSVLEPLRDHKDAKVRSHVDHVLRGIRWHKEAVQDP